MYCAVIFGKKKIGDVEKEEEIRLRAKETTRQALAVGMQTYGIRDKTEADDCRTESDGDKT
jgi:hypothetical protein